jgi:25S rRNA (cytosine2870-C5)-methyltransferase
VKIEETGLDFGVDGFTNVKKKKFDSSMKLCKRFYPHVHNMDGFFICKLKVLKSGKKLSKEEETMINEKNRQKNEEKESKDKKDVVVEEKKQTKKIVKKKIVFNPSTGQKKFRNIDKFKKIKK